jgi:hypothetical protein
MGGVNCFEPALGRSGNTLKVSHKLISKQCLGPRIDMRSPRTRWVPTLGGPRGKRRNINQLMLDRQGFDKKIGGVSPGVSGPARAVAGALSHTVILASVAASSAAPPGPPPFSSMNLDEFPHKPARLRSEIIDVFGFVLPNLTYYRTIFLM